MKLLFKRLWFLLRFRKSIPFIKDFFTSQEVKKPVKAAFLIAMIGYVLLPVDIIPDFLVFFGLTDDIAIVTFLLQQMVKIAPASLKEKHQLPAD